MSKASSLIENVLKQAEINSFENEEIEEEIENDDSAIAEEPVPSEGAEAPNEPNGFEEIDDFVGDPLTGNFDVEEECFAEDEASSPYRTNEVPYYKRYYLKYRDGKRSTPLDIAGTRSVLGELGFDGGELKQARALNGLSSCINNNESRNNNQMFCSYCGTEIIGVEFNRMKDGRMRCTNCSKTVVKAKSEIEEICKRVIANMDSFFGATIDIPISIEVVDERKLKKKIGASLGTKDSQSILILGVAINKKKKYSVILENGAPRISLIATFAHELTHIWQYLNWDANKNFKKCPKSKRLLVYEGMAKWAEIQYLYLVGETDAARREEFITRNRQDEYGIGFRLYEERYPLSKSAMYCDDTPFTKGKYPL